MDPSRDNPFIRFQAFWWGIGVFLLFAVLLGVIWLFNLEDPQNAEETAAAVRLETRAEVDAGQAAALRPESIDAAISSVAAELVARQPVAVEDPAQVVPGSPTAEKLAGGASIDFTEVDAMTDPDAAVDPAVMELGKTQYLVCAACHGQNGEGTPIGPPLANSEWVTGPVSNPIRIVVRGLEGPIEVAGQTYEYAAPMVPLGVAMNDEQLAAVLTFIRNSFGNQAPPVKPEQVGLIREAETGKPYLTVEDLIDPTP